MLLISIADCNHGFLEPEREECDSLTRSGVPVQIKYQNCTQDNIVEKCQGSDIIAVQRLVLNKKVMSQIPSCKVVTRLGVGLDNINLDDMQELGIKVVYFPGFCTEEVANHAMSMILASYRRLSFIHDRQKQLDRFWGKPNLVHGIRCASKTTIGVLGLGRIGSEVVKRLKVCGFNVIVHDPYVQRDDIDFVGLDDLFSQSDIVTIHCLLNNDTRHMVRYDLMKRMKIGGCLVNTARGDIVVSADLLQILSEGYLRSAYVDVYDPEPADALKHESLYITPHVAFYSQDSLDSLKRGLVIDSVKAFYEM